METPEDLIQRVAKRLQLHPDGAVDAAAVDALEAHIGAPVPGLLRAWMMRLGTSNSGGIEFGGESVQFLAMDDIVAAMSSYGIEEKGLVPFGEDFFGSVWFLKTSAEDLVAGGHVLLVAVQGRYSDPGNQVEKKADNFRKFLAGLTMSPDE